ncbi:lantibiotic dehydratase [Geobacillus proteiniphilus]|uniref:Lanthionine biosynthesis protein LanB n=1 Tax=Geobacillus proteiniphilus TaxID=860353 RepID=A0A1Q5T4Z5_9BACL|nr:MULTISPECIES: lantibiotic dehydratase [Geobacillus]OKO95291.1 Lanthionine biosynthesis protein LanB [Geobacillus proteiniphilus]OPX00612.1 lantibiotic biosynthesis protein SpaB [Geobacillus sp. LEMMY01]WMJ15934.1 lantibiotic dehydratase [Geobacillus proteiniphilus]
MKDLIFKNIDTFMIRTPVLSVDNYLRFFDQKLTEGEMKEHLLEICHNPVFRESILVASKSLYNKMIDFCNGKEIKKYDYFLKAIHKYLIRISTRPTPFGLFAGVDFGKYTDENTSIRYGKNKYKKFARPDLEWLMKIVKKLEQEQYDQLWFTVNDSIFLKGERAYLLHSTRKDNDKRVHEISVRVTLPFKITCELASNLIHYQTLKKELIKQFPNTSEEKIEHFLKQLIENEFLISNLRPPLTVMDQLDYLIKRLKESLIEEWSNELIDIQQKIRTYTMTPLGEGEQIYKELHKKMKKLADTKNVLQVDMKLNLQEKKLNKQVIKDLNELMHILLPFSMTYQQTDSPFSRYKQEFIEKYGVDREVPLLEMLDNDLGIGAPMDYTNPKNARLAVGVPHQLIDEQLREYFLHKYIEAVKDKKSITITEDEIKELGLDDYDYNSIPDSLDINVIIKCDSEQDLENNHFKYYIGPNLGSTHAGKSFGRFSYMMEGEEKLFETLNEEMLNLNNDDGEYVTCELVYLPNETRHANVTRNIHNSEYELALFTNSSKDEYHRLSLSDILIGIENDMFYAKSKTLNKKLIITMNNMLNTQNAPNAIRFLYDISLDGKKIWCNFPWDTIFQDYAYIPAIEYKNFVIAPRKWVINKIIKTNDKMSFTEFKKRFKNFCYDYDVPKYVYLTFADNRILLNTEDENCLRILHHEFNNGYGNIILSSYEDADLHLVKDDAEKEYVCELVIPLVKVKQENNQWYAKPKKSSHIPSFSDIRVKLPFEDWLYLKLYGVNSRADDLIAFYLSEYCREKLAKGEIEKYFYIRYADPEQHIRLRLNASEEKLLQIYPDMKQWLRTLIEKGVLSRFSIDCYEREIERYGGTELIGLAENLFFFDSIVVEDILKLKRLKHIHFSDEVIGMVSIIHYMEQFGLDYESQLDFLQQQVNKQDYREDFQKNRSVYMKVCNTDNDWQGLRDTDEGMLLLNVLNQRNRSIKEYASKIQDGLEASSELSILDSVIHLHCNRLFGIDREFEKKIRTLVAHTLYALKYIKAHGLVLKN